MICSRCNQVIPDEAYFCEHCKNPVNNTYTQQPFNSTNQNQYQNSSQTQYQQQNTYQTNQQGYAPPYTQQAYDYMINSKIDNAKTLGIIVNKSVKKGQ